MAGYEVDTSLPCIRRPGRVTNFGAKGDNIGVCASSVTVRFAVDVVQVGRGAVSADALVEGNPGVGVGIITIAVSLG